MIRRKTQTFNDGVAKIHSVVNMTQPPNKPVYGLELKETLRYKERTVGLQRFYAALQANVRIQRVLRLPRREVVSTQDVVVLPNGEQYAIAQIQYPEDIYPPVMDLSLEVVKQKYDTT